MPIEITEEALHIIRSELLNRSAKLQGAVHPTLEWASTFPEENSLAFVTISLAKDAPEGDDWVLRDGHPTIVYNNLPEELFDRHRSYVIDTVDGRLDIIETGV